MTSLNVADLSMRHLERCGERRVLVVDELSNVQLHHDASRFAAGVSELLGLPTLGAVHSLYTPPDVATHPDPPSGIKRTVTPVPGPTHNRIGFD